MGPKKKLTKKEKAKMDAEHAEHVRQEQEKERQRTLQEEQEREKKEREEAEDRERQELVENRLRRVQLKESLEFFRDFREKIAEIYAEQKKQSEWKRYMRCNGLPNAQNPGDLRQYIHMWMEKEQILSGKERNWLLMTNEETLLTQNRDIVDLTRENVRKLQVNIGDLYAERVEEVLGIMDELQEAILDPDNLTPAIYRDLLRLRAELREKLAEYIDKFSYQILCNIDRDMNLDGSTIATHVYESEVFKCQLWTQRDIPQPQLSAKEKAREESKHTEVEFSLLDTTLILPPTVKCHRAALRGLWLNYDHFSDTCHSYYMPDTNLKELNLRQCTKIEWNKRRELVQKALEQKKAALEAAQRDILATVPKDPIVIDAEKLYADYEAEQNRIERKKKGVDGLHLKPTDVNLRSHRIVGGIYCIDYLDQPKQDVKIGSKSFLTTLFHPNTLKRKHFYQSYKPPPPPQPGVRRLPEEIEAEIKLMEQNLDKLALITVKLPDNVFWFEPPIVCRLECPEEVEESLREDNEDVTNLPLTAEIPDHVPSGKKAKIDPRIIEIRDFNLLFIPPRIDLYALMTDFVVPRLPDGYGVKIDEVPGQRKGSLMKYTIKEAPGNKETIETVRRKASKTINSVIFPTNSPRSLHPKVRMKKILKIIVRKTSQDTSSSYPSSSSTPSTDDEDQVETGARYRKSSVAGGKYMLSQFIQDLDHLIELQTPDLEAKIHEIASNLSSPPEEPPETVRKPSNVSLLREDRDLLWDPRFLPATKRDEEVKDVEIVEESDSDSEDDDGDEPSESDYPPDISQTKWSTRDIHDTKFNEEKLTIQFRTGRLGCFGFAASGYSNLPYQTWEMKPDFRAPNCVTFTLTAAVVSIDVTIMEGGVRLNNLQGCAITPLAHVMDTVVPLTELIDLMEGTAIDLFPESDAFCYAEGTCEKHNIMEAHLYDCMGALALTHNFSWSRWNLLSGPRSAVLLMREMIEHRKPPNQSTLLVTPLKTIVVDCTEVSASFTTAGVPGMQYYADLYHLAREHSQPVSREKQRNMNLLLRDNVVQVLKAIRPLSYC
ncbi:dynein axonemal intermediate chain 7 [Sergentomyia squamirostris]